MNPTGMLEYILSLPASDVLEIKSAIRVITRTGVEFLYAADLVISAHQTKRRARQEQRNRDMEAKYR